MTWPQYLTSIALERYLGDPYDPREPFSFARSVQLDEAESYPEEPCGKLNAWGLHHYYVPVELGGRLASFEEMFSLMRIVGRRDLTVGIAHGKTFLGAVTVWLGGTATQKARLARVVASEAQLAWALTEEAHGSDLLATETRAVPCGSGYELSGSKWLINNATRSAAMTILARSSEDGGPRGFTSFLVFKADAPTSFELHPKIRTLGIRGADISGIRFSSCPLALEHRIGALGSGLELTLKALQITRTMCGSGSLGALDATLRLTLEFVLGRRLYGAPVFDIPNTRATLVDTYLTLLASECLLISAARALQGAPEQMSVRSAIVKVLVTTSCERAIHDLSVVLGARYYLRESYHGGVFQKFVRDSALLSVFDGSSIVNLHLIVQELRQLVSSTRPRFAADGATRAASLRSVFDLAQPLPPFEPARLELSARGIDDVVQSLPEICQALASIDDVDPEVIEHLRRMAELLGVEHRLIAEAVHVLEPHGSRHHRSPEAFDAARRYATLHLACCTLHFWLSNRARMSVGAGGEWVALALPRLVRGSGTRDAALEERWSAVVASQMLEQYRENRLFSLIPIQLAARSSFIDPVPR